MIDAKKTLITDSMSELIIETAEKIAVTSGAHAITVRKILQSLSITNRVFYNRFHNIGEVLQIVYRKTIMKIRESILSDYDGTQDFFEYVIDVVEKSLVESYEKKMQLSQYVFETDSESQANYDWWISEIKKLIDYAKERGFIKNIDSDTMSYAIWCFCRGYNADAVGRQLPKEEAIKRFRYSFSILLDGMKTNNYNNSERNRS